MTNPGNAVLYTGGSNNLARRAQEHKDKIVEGFTKKYNITKLVYFEASDDPRSAIAREEQLKGGSRQKKLDLVSSTNPEWRDLSDELFRDCFAGDAPNSRVVDLPARKDGIGVS